MIQTIYNKRKPSEKFRLPVDEDGYVIIPLDKNGKSDYGAVLRYFRLFIKEWSAEYLAVCYAEIMGKQEEEENEIVTARWIRRIEKENRVPIDPKRRWVLATLLGIPAISFGLKTSTESQGAISKTLHLLLKKDTIDPVEYSTALQTYRMSYHTGQANQIIQDIKHRITSLRKEIPLANSSMQNEMLQLLCQYYILAADIAEDHNYFRETLALLDKAIFIANQNKFYLYLAGALRQRGLTYLERGELLLIVSGLDTAVSDLEAAMSDFHQIESIEKYLSSYAKGTMSLAAGHAYASLSRNQEDNRKSLKKFEEAITVIGQQDPDLINDTILDRERYHLDRAATLLASPIKALRYPKIVREHDLYEATKNSRPDFKIRQAYNSFLKVKSYFVEGDYAMATTYAEIAVPLAQEINSQIHFARLNAFYQGILRSPFGKDDAVSALGIALLKAQQPQLFN